jgi:hypothetical protein
MCNQSGNDAFQSEAPLGSPVMEAVFQEISLEKVPVITSALHLKRKRAKAPMVVSEVRRSGRLKDKNQGYKEDSCIDR